MINIDQFVKLVELNEVHVKIKLKKISNIFNIGSFQLQQYNGKEKGIWCNIEPFSRVNPLSYKVFCKPIKTGYKGRDYYTSDLVSLINSGIVEMKIKNN